MYGDEITYEARQAGLDDSNSTISTISMKKLGLSADGASSAGRHVEEVGSDFGDGLRQHKGLGLLATAFFILGEVAGAGALSLPNAVLGTGYMGIILLIMFCVMAGYAATKLGVCWTLLEERYPEYRKESKQPFQMIGFVCYGNWMRWFVTALIQISLLGASVVFMLLIAGMLQQLCMDLWVASICVWTPIVAACLIPLTWFGTPKDFWFLGIGASVSVYVASILLTIQSIMDRGLYDVHYPNPTFKSFSLSFGAILFAYGGTTGFPTIQNDMKDRKKFTKAAILGFIGILIVYIPVTCSGYFVYGNMVQSNIALTVSPGAIRTTAQILLILHLVCAFQVIINPSFQDFEQYLHIRPEQNWFFLWRCGLRTLLMCIILFVCESVPEFSKIQDLIGGSTNTLLTFVLPPLFYIKLTSMKDDKWKERKVPLQVHAILWEIIIIGILGGIASTVSAVMELASPDALSLPCYA